MCVFCGPVMGMCLSLYLKEPGLRSLWVGLKELGDDLKGEGLLGPLSDRA